MRGLAFSSFYIKRKFSDNYFCSVFQNRKCSSYAVLCIQNEPRTHQQHAVWINVFKELVTDISWVLNLLK